MLRHTFALLCSGLAILILGCASPTATATPTPAPTVVWPSLTLIEPQKVSPGEVVLISGSGGYLFIPPGEYIEGSRTFEAFFDAEPVGSVTCYVNTCQGEFSVPETAEPGEHTITLEGGAQASILVEEVSLHEIKERLGYALLPEYIHNGLRLIAANVSGSRGRLIFDGSAGSLNVYYPVPFPVDGFLVEGDPNSARRPDEAVTQVEVGEGMGYLVRGKWSDATITMGPFMDPALAQWEYHGALSLYWTMRIQESNVGVVIQALGSSLDWIEQEDMLRIAASLRQE